MALNPVDWAIQDYGPEVFKFITLLNIAGYDIAGEVTTVGSAITKFRVGDRVAGLCHGGGGQEYSPLQEHLTTHVPASLTWEQAAVLPMGTSVGIRALFHKKYLALDLPVVVGSSRRLSRAKRYSSVAGQRAWGAGRSSSPWRRGTR